jgi:predicted dienelactone hydrolase
MKRLLLAVAMLSMFASGEATAAGYTTGYASYGDNGALELAIWYPSDAKPTALHLGAFDMTVAADAAPAAGQRPLIAISHGTGGSSLNMFDTAIALADAGFVVVAPLHAGDNYRDQAVAFTRQNFVQRPGQIGRVIDYMTTGWPHHDTIDASRIGVLGHSAGGTTALLLAGGTLEWTRVVARCKQDPNDWDCTEARKHAGSADPTATGRVTGADARVKAIFAVAPALGDGFYPHGVDAIRIPVTVWAGAKDPIVRDDAALHTMFGPRADYRLVPNAGHFAWLAPCNAMLNGIAPEICADPPGFKRAAFLTSFQQTAIAFFRAKLK